MLRSTSGIRRACVVGSTIALIGLTSGLGVLGATAAYADDVVPSDTAGTTQTGPATASDPSTGDQQAVTPTDAGTSADGTGTPGADTGGTAPTGTDATGGAAAGTPATGGTPTGSAQPPASTTGAPAAHTPAAATPAATPLAVTFVGEPRVGQSLRAVGQGFVGQQYFVWSVGGEVRDEQSDHYLVTAADAGKVVAVIVSDDSGALKSASTAAVAEDPTFTEGTDVLHPVHVTSVAGTTPEHTFQATGSPAPTYAFADLTDDDTDTIANADPTGTSELFNAQWTAPDGLDIDKATGALSGTPTQAGDYLFRVEATNGGVPAVSYLELTIKPDVPVGILVGAVDKPSFWDAFDDDVDSTFWSIDTDGTSEEIHIRNGEVVEDIPGGLPHVEQGGSLAIIGSEVDQYQNDTHPVGLDGNAPLPRVSSSVASDVITANHDEDTVVIRFPHASTHQITVEQGVSTTTFAVTVNPVVVTPPATVPGSTPGTGTVVAVTPTASRGSGRLAYTGLDDSSLVVWALGLLAAGAGVTTLRIARRRAQR